MPLTPDDIEHRPSPLHGMGVFTKKSLKQGEVATVMRGIVVHEKDLHEDTRALQIGADLWLAEDPANPHFDDYLNHACAPNLGFADGSLTLVALRDIAADEELTWHYATSIAAANWRIPCQCGADDCLGHITGFAGLDAKTQAKLRPIALDFLRASSCGDPR